ncbi:MAG: hypothetical protein KC731_03565 [Myxococcales bacterium]|nr:hypothetical protein [Myxococcales bacterium]
MLDALPRELVEDLRLRRVIAPSHGGGLRLQTDGRPLRDLLDLFEVPEIAGLPIHELLATKTLTAKLATELASSPVLQRFTRLNVVDVKIGEGLGVIVASPHARGLRALSVFSNGCASHALRSIMDAGIALESLQLSDAALTDEALTAFMLSEAASSLRWFSSRRPLSPALLQALAASPALSGLRSLRLYNSKLKNLAPLLDATFHGLECLALSGAPLTSTAVVALGKSSFAKSLAELQLSSTRLDDAGLQRLAKSGLRLRRLDLERSRVFGPGLRALADAPEFAELEFLGLAFGRSVHGQGDRAAEAVSSFSKLRELHLKQAAVTDTGIASLCAMTALRKLDLAGNYVTARGAAALAGAAFAPHLEALQLEAYPGDPKLEAAGGIALAQGQFPILRELSLRNQQIGDAGAIALSAAFPALASLDLSSCGLSAEGPAALSRASFAATLEKLDLSFNAVGASVVSLSALTRLRELTLVDAQLEEATMVRFLSQLPWSLQLIDLQYSKQLGDGVLDGLIARAPQLVEVSGRLGMATEDKCRALVAALKPPGGRTPAKRGIRASLPA